MDGDIYCPHLRVAVFQLSGRPSEPNPDSPRKMTRPRSRPVSWSKRRNREGGPRTDESGASREEEGRREAADPRMSFCRVVSCWSAGANAVAPSGLKSLKLQAEAGGVLRCECARACARACVNHILSPSPPRARALSLSLLSLSLSIYIYIYDTRSIRAVGRAPYKMPL